MYLGKNELNSWLERIRYFLVFFRYGILVNVFEGNIRYLPFKRKCRCKGLKFIRHGRTEATEKKEFMSDISDNAKLSALGKEELQLPEIGKLIRENSPDVVLVGPLERTKETYMVLEKYFGEETNVDICPFMRGINNTDWSGKTFEMLDMNNLMIFLLRECDHNIFVKTTGGDSWGDVLFRCIKLLNHLNRNYCGKKVLLISQGSIYQAMKIVLHMHQEPWKNYSAEKMFSLTSSGTNVEYGKIQVLV